MKTYKDHPLYQMVLCRFREFIREPGAVFWVFAFPILISLALGLAFRNQSPAAVDVAVVPSPGSARVIASLDASGILKGKELDEVAARKQLQSGRVAAVLVGDPVRIVVDETQQNARLITAAIKDALERGNGRADQLTIPEEKVESVGTRYIDFLIPGMLGMSVMSSSIWGIGWPLVQLRTRKLMKRLVATPMKRRHLLASYILYRLMLAVVEVSVLVAFGVFAFGMKIQGSVLSLGALALLGVFAFGGLALLTASRAQNAETASGIMNLVNMPMTILSGVFFSSEKFPQVMQPFLKLLPLTALNDGLRAIMNEGASLASLSFEAGLLAVWGAVAFAVALRIFRWM